MLFFIFFFFNDTATTEIYTLSLHDALPICARDARLRLEAEVAGRVLRDQDPDDVGAEAGPHEPAEPLENLRDLQRPGQQASGLDEALLLGRAARDPLVEARVIGRDCVPVGDDIEQLFLVGR